MHELSQPWLEPCDFQTDVKEQRFGGTVFDFGKISLSSSRSGLWLSLNENALSRCMHDTASLALGPINHCWVTRHMSLSFLFFSFLFFSFLFFSFLFFSFLFWCLHNNAIFLLVLVVLVVWLILFFSVFLCSVTDGVLVPCHCLLWRA